MIDAMDAGVESLFDGECSSVLGLLGARWGTGLLVWKA